MTPEICQAIIAFMARASLMGEEVPSFNLCVEAIRSEYERLTAPDFKTEEADMAAGAGE